MFGLPANGLFPPQINKAMAIELRKPYRREYRHTYTHSDGKSESFTEWFANDKEACSPHSSSIQGGYMDTVVSVECKRTGKMIF